MFNDLCTTVIFASQTHEFLTVLRQITFYIKPTYNTFTRSLGKAYTVSQTVKYDILKGSYVLLSPVLSCTMLIRHLCVITCFTVT